MRLTLLAASFVLAAGSAPVLAGDGKSPWSAEGGCAYRSAQAYASAPSTPVRPDAVEAAEASVERADEALLLARLAADPRETPPIAEE